MMRIIYCFVLLLAVVLVGCDSSNTDTAEQESSQSEPQDKSKLLGQALELAGQHKFDEALTVLDMLIAEYPDYAEAYFRKGNILHGQGNLLYDRSVAMDSKGDVAAATKNSVESTGKFTEAVNVFNKAIELNPDYGAAYLDRGINQILIDQRKAGYQSLDKAEEIFKAKLAEDPTDVGFKIQLVNITGFRGEFRNALEDAKTILSEHPDSEDARNLVLELEEVVGLRN